MKKVFRIVFLLSLGLACTVLSCSLLSCADDDPIPSVLKAWVEKAIAAGSGGSLSASGGIELLIPPGALPFDGTVSLGRTGEEPATVPNGNLEVLGKPITLKLPSEAILVPLQLSFPAPASLSADDHGMVVLYDGSSYFPFAYELENGTMHMDIDMTDWQAAGNNKATGATFIVFVLRNRQTPPSDQMGLKEVQTVDSDMTWAETDADATSKVLLLVHGWTGKPDKWSAFLARIEQETDLTYTEFWTFGYNSSWGIEENASLLHDLIAQQANGATIDIVAHSMGGLVSRSMIETYGGDDYISHLIMLGTPHHGSPLAALRYALGALIAAEADASDGSDADVVLYDYYSQGFRDLYTGSDFIQKMMTLTAPPVPYYALACTNDPSSWKVVSETVLEGPDDGIVEVSSAKGVPGATSPDADIQIPVALAHLQMTKNEVLYGQVLGLLKDF